MGCSTSRAPLNYGSDMPVSVATEKAIDVHGIVAAHNVSKEDVLWRLKVFQKLLTKPRSKTLSRAAVEAALGSENTSQIPGILKAQLLAHVLMNAPEMDNNGRLSAEDFVQITCEWDECTWSEHVELMMDYSGFADDDVLKVHQFQNFLEEAHIGKLDIADAETLFESISLHSRVSKLLEDGIHAQPHEKKSSLSVSDIQVWLLTCEAYPKYGITGSYFALDMKSPQEDKGDKLISHNAPEVKCKNCATDARSAGIQNNNLLVAMPSQQTTTSQRSSRAKKSTHTSDDNRKPAALRPRKSVPAEVTRNMIKPAKVIKVRHHKVQPECIDTDTTDNWRKASSKTKITSSADTRRDSFRSRHSSQQSWQRASVKKNSRRGNSLIPALSTAQEHDSVIPR